MLYHPTELVKSQDVIVRVGSIGGTSRPIITQSGATFTVSGAPTLYTLQAATTASVAFNDNNQAGFDRGGKAAQGIPRTGYLVNPTGNA